MLFSWDGANTSHIARHGVMPEEAEFVVRHAARPFPTVTRGGRMRVWGQTPGGRMLQVVFSELADEEIDPMSVSLLGLAEDSYVVRIVHARDLSDAEKGLYRKLV